MGEQEGDCDEKPGAAHVCWCLARMEKGKKRFARKRRRNEEKKKQKHRRATNLKRPPERLE